MRATAKVSLFAFVLCRAFAQAPGTEPAFEVASVKPSGPHSVRNFDGGPGSLDPGRISYTRATLHDVLVYAWGLEDYQQVEGPGWTGSETYDIVATIPPGTSKEQFRKMLQNLLSDRFKLTLHHETRDFPVYELVAGKNGPKLKESVEGRPMTNREGFPELPAGKPAAATRYEANRGRLSAHEEPLRVLARMLSQPAGRMVIDKTGLTGKYDFTLEFRLRDMAGADDDPSPNVFSAVQQQLGLRLEDKKAPFDVVVVDHAEKVPTEN